MKIFITLLIIFTSSCTYGQKILPINKGVTLAQTMIKNKVHTLLVLDDNGDFINAIDLNVLFKTDADIISLYHTIGFNKLVSVSLQNNIKAQSYAINSLLSPAGNNKHHVASGLNYRKHANEVDSKQIPFLFVKATKPTRQQNIQVNDNELLDYEVELCARPLTTLTELPDKKEPAFGFFLCGDFTDRAELLRNINLDNIQSGRGFSDAKSKTGYFPTGPYMVISRNWQQFIENTELSLVLNGKTMQKTMAKQMVWPLTTIIEKSWLYTQENKPLHTKKVLSLLPNKVISEQMTFLTGTPEGTLFKAPNTIFKIKSAIKYIFTGAFVDMKLTNFVISDYSQQQLKEKTFLQPQDKITLKTNFLGKIDLKIVKSSQEEQ
jgi:2-keto-4-pentenoate hydratase/2-oxohepta-3-ene-1,7-dioic acid hydratase in catechol pathway